MQQPCRWWLVEAAASPSLPRLLKSRRVTKLVKGSRLRRTELIMVTYFSVLSKIIYLAEGGFSSSRSPSPSMLMHIYTTEGMKEMRDRRANG